MRKQDIIITTPEKSVIYAIGTAPERSERVWYDPVNAHYPYSRNYTPGYVLEIRDSGFVVALVAQQHPDSEYAKHYGQATPLDALDYTLKDYEVRQEVLAEHSHWPLDKERADARMAALAKLKEVPKGWDLKVMRASQVRMLWADYSTRLDAAVADEKAKQARAKAEREAEHEARKALIQRIADLNIGLPQEEVKYYIRRASVDYLDLPKEVVKALVESYEKAAV